MLSPWSRMEGLYFDETKEEDHFMYDFKKDMDDYEWEHQDPDGKIHLRINPKDAEDYYRVLNNLAEINDGINVYMNATNEDNIIIEKSEDVDAKNVDEDDEEKSNDVNEEN